MKKLDRIRPFYATMEHSRRVTESLLEQKGEFLKTKHWIITTIDYATHKWLISTHKGQIHASRIMEKTVRQKWISPALQKCNSVESSR